MPPFRIRLPKMQKGGSHALTGNKISGVDSADGVNMEDTLIVEAYTPPDPGPYPQDQPKQNSVRFTPTQIGAIISGIQPGLTMVMGPPVSRKTDTTVQILNVLSHNCPSQRTLIITHSNQALNDLFEKIMQVTTVDKFQGQQNDFILLSLVRTRFVGHLRDVRRLVVGMSRARLGLYVFCRRSLFEQCYELQPTFQLLLQRPDHLALNLNEITSYTERHVEDTGPIHLNDRYMSHQFDHYMTYSGQNNQQNSTTVFNAMDTDTPSVQHESSMEEDTKIDADVLPTSHSNGEVDKEASRNDENDRLPESNSSEENMTE